MRDTSIISIIRKHGLDSRRLDPKFRIKYRAVLCNLSSFSNEKLKLINVIDNMAHPELSVSDRCMITGCNKHIRYENLVEEKQTGNIIVCGSNCCATLLGLSELQQKKLHDIEEALKEKAELEEWKKANSGTVRKLEELSKYNLPFYQPFINEIEASALTPEDTDFINGVNIKLVLSDLKILDVIDDLLKYEEKEELIRILRSIRNHSLIKGKHFSKKQKDFVVRQYEKMLEKRENVTVMIRNGYEYKEFLKERGYVFSGKEKIWKKTIKRADSDKELADLRSVGISEGNISVNRI